MKNYQKRGPFMIFLGIVLILLVLGGVAYGAYHMGVRQGVGITDGSFNFEDGAVMPHMRGYGDGYMSGRGFGGGHMGGYGFGMGFGGFFGFLFMFLFFGFLFRVIFGWGMHPRHYPGRWRGYGPDWREDEEEDSSDDPKPSKKSKKDK